MRKYITNTINKKTVKIENGEFIDGRQSEIDELINGNNPEWELTREIHSGEWRLHEFRRRNIAGNTGSN